MKSFTSQMGPFQFEFWCKFKTKEDKLLKTHLYLVNKLCACVCMCAVVCVRVCLIWWKQTDWADQLPQRTDCPCGSVNPDHRLSGQRKRCFHAGLKPRRERRPVCVSTHSIQHGRTTYWKTDYEQKWQRHKSAPVRHQKGGGAGGSCNSPDSSGCERCCPPAPTNASALQR